jgi:hypothetical protein
MGEHPPPPFVERPLLLRWWDDGSSFVLVRFAILRLLGLVYFVAFGVAFTEGPALIGEHGLLPMRWHLADVARVSGSRLAGFFAAPSIFWLDASDGALRAATGLGALLALAVMAGVTNAGVMLVLWALQLSLIGVGQIFWGYGWEILLLETGLLAALLCPLRSVRPFASAPPTTAIWLLRWLIVRVMLGAGLIKLRGDPCWRDLTCLVFHYETQPNPTPAAWLLHQMPGWFSALGVLFNHVVEVVAPLLVLGPRRARRIAGGLFVVFQVILIVSGNLSFFNWLTIVPSLACFDDELLSRVWPARLLPKDVTGPSRLHVTAGRVWAFFVAVLSVGPVVNLASDTQLMNASFDPLHLVNTYGAFGTVSRWRDEIVIEGTRDEVLGPETKWEEYELPCKPGDPMRRPCIITPWHHRLDWQMWFAAMSSYEEEPWIAVLVDKMLRGDRSIEPLLARDPFPDAPPRWVRARRYRYEFTRGRGPAWWTRRDEGEYMRPLAKDDPELAVFLRERGLAR